MQKHVIIGAAISAFLFSHVFANETATRWWEPSGGAEVDAPEVLGFWRFDSEAGLTADSSSHAHSGTRRGALWNAEGRFGGCLESGAGWPITDDSHSIHVAKSPVLSPGGPFTVEMWVRPKDAEAFPPEVAPILMDSKYVPDNHTGFQFAMTGAGGDGTRRLLVVIGTGAGSETWYAPDSLKLEPGQWRHLAFTYDARGTVAFFVDGGELGAVTKPQAGPMAMAVRPLAIGDRIGSNYRGFPGFIDEVRITRGIREFRPVGFEPHVARFVFVRMSEGAVLEADLVNQTGVPLRGANVSVLIPGSPERQLPVPDLEESGRHPIRIPVDVSLRPGDYSASVAVEVPGWGGGEGSYRSGTRIPFVIVPRPLPHRMPVVMWGLGGTDGVIREIPRLKDIGFTHCFGLRGDYQKIWDEGAGALPTTPEGIRDGREMLNVALENDIRIITTVAPARWLRTAKVGEPFVRIDRKGNHYGREDVGGLFKPVRDFCYNTGAAFGRAWGDHPAYAAALLHTEVRGESQVSFHPEEIEAYRNETGAEIPEAVTIKNGVDYKKLPGFPEDRVIADDDPILKYLSWFWRKGDGWNGLNTRLHEGFSETIGRDDFWTFHDPAARVPSISGSGGKANVLAHWTYSYPDPIRIGLCADELFEMARVNGHGQDVMKMTQVIWYRSQTAPENATSLDPSPWVDRDPDAAYITIALMHLREAFWWKLSRPIRGIMYHGWQSLVETDSPGAYRYTNPSTWKELRRLTDEVIEPLGPSLLQIPDPPAEVAFLESFTSQMFARRGTYGWNHTWAGDLYHVLMYAQLQPKVMYEESLLKDGGLDGIKLLVMGDCDVLTESVVKRISEFQAAGGIVIGDGEVCPAIEPDHVIERFSRTKKADEDRAKLQAAAKELRAWLDPKYSGPCFSTNPDVVTRVRKYGTTDYVFAVNDRREFGTYVGGYGLVMENGLPSETAIAVRRGLGHVYDLVAGRRAKSEGDCADSAYRVFIEANLGPCEGRIYMITDRPIRDVEVTAPESARRGERTTIEVAVTDGEKPIDAVIPVRLRITDPEGVEAERTGYYGAAGGKLSVSLDIAPNDRPGLWEIRVRELASGLEGRSYLRVDGNPEK